jgi:hemolysin III
MSLPDEHPRLAKRAYTHGELIADGFIHAVAIVGGIIAFSTLFVLVAMRGAVSSALALAIYAAGFFLLFGFSLAYNMTPPSPLKWMLRKFDHSSIYLMIAGTYTALLTQMHDTTWAWALSAIVWGGSLSGIALKLLLPGRFDRVSLLIYLMLGWVALVAIKPLSVSLPSLTIVLVIAGGVMYSGGVIFYRWNSLKFQNALWHACVVIAAGCHFAGIAHAMTNGT